MAGENLEIGTPVMIARLDALLPGLAAMAANGASRPWPRFPTKVA